MLSNFFNHFSQLAEHFVFAWPWVCTLLPLPFLVRLIKTTESENNAYLNIPFYDQLITHIGQKNQQKPAKLWLKSALSLIWILMIIATARPQFIGEPISMPISGRDLMLAIDISGSMETADMIINNNSTTRLNAVKLVASDFIKRRQGDRLGLILFGQQAYLQTPLTFDTKTVNIFLDEAVIGLAGQETAIGDAIGLAVKRLRKDTKDTKESKVLILLTDGANTTGNIAPLDATELAAKEKVTIYTIGIGAESMQVQDFFGRRTINPSANLDEKTLKQIAHNTDGQYFRAKDTKSLDAIYELLDKLEPVSEENKTYRPISELYIYPLAAILILTLALMSLKMTKSKFSISTA